MRKKDASANTTGADGTRPATTTMGRRRRPSTKARAVESPSERRAKAARERSRATTGRGSKKERERRVGARTEDKREAPDEMVTTAEPMNYGAERDNKKRKGKATHALEARTPGKRPSRKSTRRAANHIKRDSQQRRQTTRAARSPKRRHEAAG
jgi:hypothetical protein